MYCKGLTKQELIDAMAAKSGLTKADSSRALEAFISVVTETVKKATDEYWAHIAVGLTELET